MSKLSVLRGQVGAACLILLTHRSRGRLPRLHLNLPPTHRVRLDMGHTQSPPRVLKKEVDILSQKASELYLSPLPCHNTNCHVDPLNYFLYKVAKIQDPRGPPCFSQPAFSACLPLPPFCNSAPGIRRFGRFRRCTHQTSWHLSSLLPLTGLAHLLRICRTKFLGLTFTSPFRTSRGKTFIFGNCPNYHYPNLGGKVILVSRPSHQLCSKICH